MMKFTLDMKKCVYLWIVIMCLNLFDFNKIWYLASLGIAVLLCGNRERQSMSNRFLTNAFIVLLFSGLYAIFELGDKGPLHIAVYGATPICSYFIGYRFMLLEWKKDTFSQFRKLFDCIAISLFIYATLNMSYLFYYGWSYRKRGTVDIWTGEWTNPTNTGGLLVLTAAYIPLLIINWKTLPWKKKIFYLSIVGLAVVYTLLLGNRTYLVITSAVTFISLLYYICRVKNGVIYLFKLTAILCALLAAAFIAFSYDLFNIQTFWKGTTFYQRQQYMGTQYDVTIMENDRFKTWALTWRTMPERFFGGKPDGAIIPYAHNFWLDIQWAAGTVPFVLSILFSISFIKVVYKYMTRREIPVNQRAFIVSVTTVLLLELAVEPIIEGYYYILIIFFLLFGAILQLAEQR